ncbi:Fc receptor-like protein 5 isoform X3 [Oncorhynchus keta]|uniref:Fc receptor-like protein 5 isoform X3 n=1 Tax=Oncorhynchus keta TaxID=8018 RepID=UPI00227CC263|nr:Fc receptor-like protein 5 isoform X3 [Oncorhynchus keta]
MKKKRELCLLPVLGGSSLPSPILIGPDKAYLNSKVVFQCRSPGSPPPNTYELLKDGNHLVATSNDLQDDQSATFFLKISVTSEGSYHCRVTAGGNMGLSGTVRLQVVIPVSGTMVTSDPDPPILYEGLRLTLTCDVTKGSHLSYTWFYNRQEVTSSPTSPLTPLLLWPVGNTLVVERVTAKHAGNYSCIAGTRMQTNSRFSSSREVTVRVKAYLSVPQISFTISKEGSSYRGNVTCRSSRGTPPVTFYLFLDDKEVGSDVATESLVAWFPTAMVPGRDMGTVRCTVESDAQRLTSRPLTLVVVPVGGSPKVDVEYLYRVDSKMAAARLQCLLGLGTFPFFSWSLNGSLLLHPSEGDSSHPSHALADGGRTLFLTEITLEDSGYYRCRARDSYDVTSAWVESQPVLVQVTEVATTTIEVMAIVFCCFLMLTLAGGVACVMRMLNRQRDVVASSEQRARAAHERRFSEHFCINPDPLPLSDITTRSGVKQVDTSCVDSDVENQTLEITI